MAKTEPRRRMDKAELFAAVGYRPHAGQLAVHRSGAPRRVLACGVRWGKSTCAIYECVAALLEPRDEAIGWVVSATYDLAARIFQQVVALVQQKFEHRVVELDPRERRIVVVNLGGGRSELRAKSADNPDSLLGEGLDFLVVDEAARLKGVVWHEHLSQRLIDKGGWALLLSTPHGRGWFWKVFRRGQGGRDPQYESWSSPSWENPLLDRAVVEGERVRLSPEAFAEQYGGEFKGPDLDPCDTCGGPDRAASGVVVVNGGEALARCPECAQAVDAAGRTLVARGRDGRGQLLVVRLEVRPGGEDCAPERCVPEVPSEPAMPGEAFSDPTVAALLRLDEAFEEARETPQPGGLGPHS